VVIITDFVFLRNPEKNWNPNCVKGLVVTLITVKDISTSKALEAVAGGKLYNIVVDTEVCVSLSEHVT